MRQLNVVEISEPVAFVDLTAPYLFREYEITYDGVLSDREIVPAGDSLLTMYFGYNGVVHEGANHPHYLSEGSRIWNGEPDKQFIGQWPIGVQTPHGPPQNLQCGARLSIDTATRTHLGAAGVVRIWCAGTVSGNPQVTKFKSYGYKGFIGGDQFPGQPGVPYDWVAPLDCGGHYTGAKGQIPNKFRFRANGAAIDGFNLVSGRWTLYGRDQV